MYPQNDKIGVSEVLEIKTFFGALPWWRDLLIIFLKFSPRVLHWWSLCKVTEKKLKFCNLTFYHYLDNQNPWREINCKKYNIPWRSVQRNKLLKPIAINA